VRAAALALGRDQNHAAGGGESKAAAKKSKCHPMFLGLELLLSKCHPMFLGLELLLSSCLRLLPNVPLQNYYFNSYLCGCGGEVLQVEVLQGWQ